MPSPMWIRIIVLCGPHTEPEEWILLASDQEFRPLSRDCHFFVRGCTIWETTFLADCFFGCWGMRIFVGASVSQRFGSMVAVLDMCSALSWYRLNPDRTWHLKLFWLGGCVCFLAWCFFVVVFYFVFFCPAKGDTSIAVLNCSLMPWCYVSGWS